MAVFNLTPGNTGDSGNDPNAAQQAALCAMMGPQAVDHEIRMAIQHCWMMMPTEKKTVASVEVEIRRLVDRALKDLHDDAQAFGLTSN